MSDGRKNTRTFDLDDNPDNIFLKAYFEEMFWGMQNFYYFCRHEAIPSLTFALVALVAAVMAACSTMTAAERAAKAQAVEKALASRHYMVEVFDNGQVTIDLMSRERESVSYSGELE